MKRVEVISESEDGTYEVECEDGPYVRWTEANYHILCTEAKLKAQAEGLQLRLDNQIKQKHELKAKVEEMQAVKANNDKLEWMLELLILDSGRPQLKDWAQQAYNAKGEEMTPEQYLEQSI